MLTIRLQDLPLGTRIAVKRPSGRNGWLGSEEMMKTVSLCPESEQGSPVLLVRRPEAASDERVQLKPGDSVWLEVTSLDHILETLLNSYLGTGEKIVVEAFGEPLHLSLCRPMPIFELAGLMAVDGDGDVAGVPTEWVGPFSPIGTKMLLVRRVEISAIWIEVDVLEMWAPKELERALAIESRVKIGRQELFVTSDPAGTDPQLYLKGVLSMEEGSFFFEADGFSMIFTRADLKRLNFLVPLTKEEIKGARLPEADELVLIEASDKRTQVAANLLVDNNSCSVCPFINGHLGKRIVLASDVQVYRLIQ
jgi:hypothetical protein